jgi:flagellar basal-body rod modification protein FlgD
MATISNPITSNPTTSPAPAPSSSSDPTANLGNEQTFLQLLVAQLQYQDPTNPVDGTQFVSQLAQFSELEQMINVNTNLKQIQADLTQNGQTSSNPAPSTPVNP